ncbi:hypothetical protein [Nocardia sp. CDC160]|uniref:hypothetical protein n=1 Tax=Nocardia sp. CDC160 TaxID=3112166 RepID=UPI002DBB3B5C|nr:hypothetical protein [Nocardia sp. CDC160]
MDGDLANTFVIWDPSTGKYFSQPGAQSAPTAVGPASKIVTVADAWAALQRCYNCVFPIGGAPKQMPKVGDRLDLSVGAGGHAPLNKSFPVEVTQMDYDGKEINIEYATLEGHPDGVGSTIHFRIFKNSDGELSLEAIGRIAGGMGSLGGGPARTGYDLISSFPWQRFMNNLVIYGLEEHYGDRWAK